MNYITQLNNRNLLINGVIFPTPVVTVESSANAITIKLYSKQVYILSMDYRDITIEYSNGLIITTETYTRNQTLDIINQLGNYIILTSDYYSKAEIDNLLSYKSGLLHFHKVSDPFKTLTVIAGDEIPEQTLENYEIEFVYSSTQQFTPIIRKRENADIYVRVCEDNDFVFGYIEGVPMMYVIQGMTATPILTVDKVGNTFVLRDADGKIYSTTDNEDENAVVTNYRLAHYVQLLEEPGSTNPDGYILLNIEGVDYKVLLSSVSPKLEFQDSVLNIQIDDTLDPGLNPTEKARYIITDKANLHANFGVIVDLADNDIVQYNTDKFEVAFVPTAGTMTTSDADANKILYFSGSTWVEKAFEATTASMGLKKVGLDIRPDFHNLTEATIASFPSIESDYLVFVDTSDSNLEKKIKVLDFITQLVNALGVTNGLKITDGKIVLQAASTTQFGGTVYSTDEEAKVGTSTSKSITPSNLAAHYARVVEVNILSEEWVGVSEPWTYTITSEVHNFNLAPVVTVYEITGDDVFEPVEVGIIYDNITQNIVLTSAVTVTGIVIISGLGYNEIIVPTTTLAVTTTIAVTTTL